MQRSNKLVVGSLSVFGILIVLGLLTYFTPLGSQFAHLLGGDSRDPLPAQFRNLVEGNEEFALGQELLNEDPESALPHFKQSLESAETNNQRAIIERTISWTYFRTHKAEEVIKTLQGIAYNEAYDKAVRAEAFFNIPELVQMFPDENIPDAIFADEPLRGFLWDDTSPGRYNPAYIRLYASSTALYSFIPAELRFAQLLAEVVHRRLEGGGNITDPEIIAFIGKIQRRLERVEAADIIKQLSDRPGSQRLLVQTFIRKGMLKARLVELGLQIKGIPEDDFREAVRFADKDADHMALAAYNYASYLARYENSRLEDIRALLAPFYETQTYATARIVRSIENQAIATKLFMADEIELLAKADPKFKTYLIGKGWKF